MLLIVPSYKLWFSFAPLGPLYIAAAAMAAGEPVELLDVGRVAVSAARLRRLAARHRLIGISANISQAFSARRVARIIRAEFPGSRIVWGGPYPSVEYQKLLPGLADIVVIGEGERQIADIVRGAPLEGIAGIAYWDGGGVVVNPRDGYIEDLDTLPFPAWGLSESLGRRDTPGRHPCHVMITERGCPFHCLNCTKFIHGDAFRVRGLDEVVREMRYLVDDLGSREIHIWDDNFTLQPRRVKELCRKIIEAGLHRRVRFTLPNGIRADIHDEEMFDLMRQAGFYYVNVAIESGDQQVLDKLGKKLDLGKVPSLVESLVGNGFRVGLFFMAGLPFETRESLEKTLRLLVSLPAHHAYIAIATPFPGTPLYDLAAAAGEIARYDEEDGVCYDHQDNMYVPGGLSAVELRNWVRRAYWRFYFNPRRVARVVAAIIGQGDWFNDFRFMFRNGLAILLRGHR